MSVPVRRDDRGLVRSAEESYAGAAGVLAREYLDLAGGFPAADEFFGPAAGVKRRVNELGAGVGFVQPHLGMKITGWRFLSRHSQGRYGRMAAGRCSGSSPKA